jgi:type II secretory pathway component PulM
MLGSRGARWLAGGAAAVILALAVAWLLFVPAADWLAHHDAGSATGALHETALDDARGRLLTLGAGLAAVAALVFTALNFSLLRRNSEQADQWQRRTHELTAQGQVTDRYAKAIEQLGSDKLDVRIGGIYALERIARDSARDHPVVMEVLTAFIRERSLEQWPLPDPDGRERKRRTRPDVLAVFVPAHAHEVLGPPAAPGREGKGWTRPDVQAAVTVVGRRDQERDIRGIDLIGANLTGATLAKARLAGASLFGADLSGARLDGAILDGADLSGSDLTRARLSFARLAGTDLTGALLPGAELMSARLDRAVLMGADLTGAGFYSASLEGAILLSACLKGANLTETKDLATADLTGADLAGVRWPGGTPVPDGWEPDAGSGLLQRAGTDPAPAEGG